jgi:hypothetical protein
MDASGIKLPFCSSNSGVLDQALKGDLPLLNMLNVRYYLSEVSAKSELEASVPKLGTFDLDVYESSAAWPRAFFVDKLGSSASERDFVSQLRQGDGKPFAMIADMETGSPTELRQLLSDSFAGPDRQIVTATNYRLTTNTTSFKVKTPGPGIVVLTEPYVADDFQLQVNGKPGDYFRVNSAFRGVFVSTAGDYQISFTYWPRHLTASLWVSVLGLALLAVWMTVAWKASHRET